MEKIREKLELVLVYTAPDKMTAELLRGFLESNGIKSLIEANPGPEGAFLGGYGGSAPFNPWQLYVAKENVEKANEILKDFNEGTK